MLTEKILFNFYRRYRWTAANFTTLQETLIGYAETLLGALGRAAVLKDFDYVSDSGLDVTVSSGIAVNERGDILAVEGSTEVTVDPSVRSLIVARPTETSENPITNPTNPAQTVDLNEVQGCEIVAIAGDAGNYPSKGANDVILFGVIAGVGTITTVDRSKCELIGKSGELRNLNTYDMVVGNKKFATHIDMATAADAATGGERIRVVDSESIATAVTFDAPNLRIDCDPGVEFTKDGAATGVILAASGIDFKGGRFKDFSAGNNSAIGISADYCSVFGTRFNNNTNSVIDVEGTSSITGVIEE